MTQVSPWSVKGIDRETRDLARDAAKAAGLTMGAWLDRAIRRGPSLLALPAGGQVPLAIAAGSSSRAPEPDDRPISAASEQVLGAARRAGLAALADEIEQSEARFNDMVVPIALRVQDLAQRLVDAEKFGRESLPEPPRRAFSRPEALPKPPSIQGVEEGQRRWNWRREEPRSEAPAQLPPKAESQDSASDTAAFAQFLAKTVRPSEPAAVDPPPSAEASGLGTSADPFALPEPPQDVGQAPSAGPIEEVPPRSGRSFAEPRPRERVESAIRRHSSGIATIINRITIGLASFILGAGLSWSALTFAPLLGLPPFGPELATQLRHAVDETSGLVADFAYEAVYATAKASRAATTWVMNLVGVPSADQSSDAGVIVSLPTLDTGRSLDLTPVPPADTRSADSGAKRGDDRADPPPGRGTVLASAGVGTEVGDAASARASLAFPTVPQGPIDEGAVQRLEVRAKAGHAEAQHDLAMVYVQEFGRFRDISKAAFWFREAAVQGLANAQYNLGVLYDKGLGVERDEVRALLWYHSAAEQGHARAQFNLGVIYAEGRGIPLDYGEAFRWFRRAADQGIPRAYYNMAIMQAYGLGAPANSMSARAYLTRAALLGDVEARRTLADNDRLQLLGLAPSRRNAAEGRTTPEVVAAIQHLLNEQNLDAGPPDGVIGDGTRQAIRRYQNSAGLAVTGQPTTDLLDHMVSRVIR